MASEPSAVPNLQSDKRRFRRAMRFFRAVAIQVAFWEVLLKPILGEEFVAKSRMDRAIRITRRFRDIAIEMGGVMIKLGQFISARLDVIPEEIITELQGLQDEVPPEPLEVMLSTIEHGLQMRIEEAFLHFDKNVKAAASLGQVYRATLHNGEKVVVKVQRPEIRKIVATDLAALRVVSRWLMYWPLVAKRADVPLLLEEFAETLWEELDYKAEVQNAELFRRLFAHDLGVYIPEIHSHLSSDKIIVMEDVTSIKITDAKALDAAGIDRAQAARRLLDVYLRMVFEFNVFHADPHPGNLFLYPIPDNDSRSMFGRGAIRNGKRPFYVIFVDFGMTGRITERVKEGLKELLIGVATHDTARIIGAYQTLGVLLPSADTERISEAQAEALSYVWGKSTLEIARMPDSERSEFVAKYRDILFDMPFQVPQDFIYLARAAGILSGICVTLDPSFNPWEDVSKYARRFILREVGPTIWLREALNLLMGRRS